jgi:membrane fusion protein (multidrug efflux system)
MRNKIVKTFGLTPNLIALSLGVVCVLSSCTHEKKEVKVVDNFPVITPFVADTSVNEEYVAEIQAMQNVELRSRVKGYLDKISVDEGQQVKAGQVLFSISSQEYREDLAKAKAELSSAMADVKTAELDVQNTRLLVDRNVVSRTELEMAQAKLDALKAKVEEARANESSAALNLSYTTIKAPFDGIVNRIPNKVGSLIDEGTLLTSISNDKEMLAYFNVSENEYFNFLRDKEQLKKQLATLVLADGQVYDYKGIVETVDGEIDKNTGNIAFRARFKNPELLLKHGATGKIVVSKKLKDALIIPQKSTFEVQEKTYVYLVDKNNVVQLRSITPQFRLENTYIISGGLNKSDRFLYEGIQQVKEGDKITPRSVKTEIVELKKERKSSLMAS